MENETSEDVCVACCGHNNWRRWIAFLIKAMIILGLMVFLIVIAVFRVIDGNLTEATSIITVLLFYLAQSPLHGGIN